MVPTGALEWDGCEVTSRSRGYVWAMVVEEWEPPELRVHGDGARREGRESRAGEGAMLEPDLASAPDQGLNAQLVLVPDRGLDAGGKRLECGAGDAGVARECFSDFEL
jgi:hypothetical protein